MPAHGFRTPIWAENLFGEHSPGKPDSKPSEHQSSATVTLAPSNQDLVPLPGGNTLRQESNAARRAIQSSPTPMQPLAASALHDLRSSTVLSTSIEFESLVSYIDRGSRYGRFGTTNPPRRLVDLDSVKSINIPIHSQSLTQRPKKGRRPSITNLFPSLRRQLSRARKAPTADPTAHGDRSTASDPSVRSANPPQEYADGASLHGSISRNMNLPNPMVSPTILYDEHGSMHRIQAVERLSPVPTRSVSTLHPPKKRFSELSFSPSTPDLQAVSENKTSGIPSLCLPDPRPIPTNLPNPEAGPSEQLAASQDIPQEMNSRFDRLDVGSQYLSPSSCRRHGAQRSLDESAFRHTEPRRALRRVGNLQNRSLGGRGCVAAGGSMGAENWKEGRGVGLKSEGKENEQVCCSLEEEEEMGG